MCLNLGHRLVELERKEKPRKGGRSAVAGGTSSVQEVKESQEKDIGKRGLQIYQQSSSNMDEKANKQTIGSDS